MPEAFTVGASATPVLLLSGGIDRPPPRHAQRVADALGAKAGVMIIPNAGHGQLGSGCVPDLLFPSSPRTASPGAGAGRQLRHGYSAAAGLRAAGIGGAAMIHRRS